MRKTTAEDRSAVSRIHGECYRAADLLEPRRTEYPENRHYDLSLKVLILGSGGVGKRAFARRFQDGEFDEAYSSSADSWTRNVYFRDENALDENGTGIGEQKYAVVVRSFVVPKEMTRVETYFKRVDGVVLAFDLTDHASLERIPDTWFLQCEQQLSPSPQYILVGLKADLPNRRVRFEEAAHLATVLGVPYVECSSADGAQVDDALATLLHRVINAKRSALPDLIAKNLERLSKSKIHQESMCTIT